ncbi:GNAT family N-acetyltransferase [Cnuibacter sp. UC19_7]|uniref:GNAT family N-acetyltransferase n=1 Tax=Cnuibacter sp. UC19_7 TaxID=3350166 RepID=UPI00366F8DCE
MIRIRSADLAGGDAAAVGALVEAYLRQTEQEKAERGLAEPVDFDGALPPRYAAEVTDPARAFDADDVLLAVDDDRAVGVVVSRSVPEGTEIKRLWVDPGHRGQRIAEALLSAVVAGADGDVRLSVWEWRAPALAVYRRLGFAEVPSWDARPALVCLVRAGGAR